MKAACSAMAVHAAEFGRQAVVCACPVSLSDLPTPGGVPNVRKRIPELKLLLVPNGGNAFDCRSSENEEVHSQLLLLLERFQTDLQASTP